MIRTGFGVDIHPLQNADALIIGGVRIPCNKGATGHSDADVLLHTICDALLGAAALGDIGTHFPDTDEANRDRDSALFLKDVNALLKKAGFSVVNIDATVCLEKPKIAPYINDMRLRISATLGIEKERVSVKATRGEGLGYVGRQEGVAAYASVLIESTP